MARKRRIAREKVDVNMPVDLLDNCEDMAFQAYMTRTDFLLQCIRKGAPLLADEMGLEFDRENKRTYKDRDYEPTKRGRKRRI